MKEKDLIIQGTKSLTPKKNSPKQLSVKEKNTSLTKTKKKETALKTVTKKETALTKSTKGTKKVVEPAKETKKKTTKSNSTTAKSTAAKKITAQKFTAHVNEYFDLPYRYNETIVKLLAQTPKRLFVYWDISDKDRENFVSIFGEDFFDKTLPILRIKNETQNYTFDIEVNDFANSWYIDVNDDDSKYSIELYRKFKENTVVSNMSNNTVNIKNNLVFITSSNKINSPNGKIISNTYPRTIEYKNIKTNTVSYKQVDKPNDEFSSLFLNDENYDTEKNASSSR